MEPSVAADRISSTNMVLSGHVPVDGVQQERPDRESYQDGDRHGSAERVDGQGGDAAGEDRPGQRDLVGRPEGGGARSVQPVGQAGGGGDPVGDAHQPPRRADTDRSGNSGKQDDLRDKSGDRTCPKRGHCASVIMVATLMLNT